LMSWNSSKSACPLEWRALCIFWPLVCPGCAIPARPRQPYHQLQETETKIIEFVSELERSLGKLPEDERAKARELLAKQLDGGT